jgi:hypothetical protein
VRFRSPENVLENLEVSIKQFGIRNFHSRDGAYRVFYKVGLNEAFDVAG